MTLAPFEIAAVLVVLAALLGYLNLRLFRLDQSVALTVMGALASLILVGIDRLWPGGGLGRLVVGFLGQIDFHATLMNGMLSFLLFAGALHVNWPEMRRGRWPILALTTIGVVLSTLIVGFGFHWIARAFGLDVPLAWCLVFGALISPTDPVAVMAVLQRTTVPPTLQATVAGESLFNDGVGVVVFAIILETAIGGTRLSIPDAATLFAVQAGGGIVLGWATGRVACAMMASIDDYKVEVLISLALVMGGYTAADWIGVSGPVAMAAAGLMIGNSAVAGMEDGAQDYMLKFWSLIDDILNAVLFLLIGLEVVVIQFDSRLLMAGLAAIPLVLAARAITVMARWRPCDRCSASARWRCRR